MMPSSHRRLRRGRLRRGLIAPIVVTLTLLPGVVSAQYFGRNKVQYQSFEFQVLRTPHFDIYFYKSEAEDAKLAAVAAERWYARLSRFFNHKLRGRQPIIAYGSGLAFQQTNAIQGEIGEGTGGVTEPLRRRVVLPIGGPLAEMNHVLGHELVHAFQFDITGAGPTGATGGIPAASELPLWFIEGMAEYLSLGPVDPLTAMWMRDAVQHRMPTFEQLDDPRFFPYRFGQALLAYVGGQWGDSAISSLLRAAASRGGMDPAIRRVLGVTPDALVKGWQAATHAAYDPIAAATVLPESAGRRVVVPTSTDNPEYNVSPALSPDGSRLMFLSSRGLFSIDLYLADAATGNVIRRVTSTATNPHFQSLEFISSAGAWDQEGRRFVFAGVSGGRPTLVLYDVEHGRTEREIPLKQLGEAVNPSWSPDGRQIVFTGLSGGFTDLYVYDLTANRLRRLTNDAYADLTPTWSPDGRTIAFATDRFGTDVERVAPAPYQLALLDPASGAIRRAGAGDSAKEINPQWTPDGRSLLYIADRAGIPNVWRLDLESGSDTRLTNLYTGASGITSLSPALSVAARSGTIALSLFVNGGFAIHTLEGSPAVAAAAAGAPAATPPANAALLPPLERRGAEVPEMLHDMAFGLPMDTTFSVHPYRPSLGLEYIGQPSLAVGSDVFGTFVGGGAALYWRDILGNHNLVTGLSVYGGLNDVSALVAYANLKHRLNWGINLQQAPFRTGAFAAGPAVINGDTVFAQQELLQRQINREANVVLAYPFSPQQRVEFGAGYSNISFTNELRTQGFSFTTGDLVIDEKQDLPAPSALNLGNGMAALVYDNTVFGAVGPILGQRYRFEFSPSFGSLTLYQALGDYRRYFQPVRPLTVALRLLHFGRYGPSAEDERLTPLFLGYDGLVRGYQLGSFDASECAPTPANPNSCPVFDRLVGSRIAVANLELRFPLFGALGLGQGYYGAFPLEFGVFGDGGLAWTGSESPTITGGTRKPVFSTGATLRANIFGFLTAQLDLVHPFDRPGKNFVWQFSFLPAF